MEKLKEQEYSAYNQIIEDYLKCGVVEIPFLNKYNLIVEVHEWYEKCLQFINTKDEFCGVDIYKIRHRKHLLKNILKADVLMSEFAKVCTHSLTACHSYKNHDKYAAHKAMSLLKKEQCESPLMRKYLNRIDIFDEDLLLIYHFHCNMLKYAKLYSKNKDRKYDKEARGKYEIS